MSTDYSKGGVDRDRDGFIGLVATVLAGRLYGAGTEQDDGAARQLAAIERLREPDPGHHRGHDRFDHADHAGGGRAEVAEPTELQGVGRERAERDDPEEGRPHRHG